MPDFKHDMSQIIWDDVLSERNVDIAYKKFETKLNSVLDKHAPLKKKRVRNKETPWMNADIKKNA